MFRGNSKRVLTITSPKAFPVVSWDSFPLVLREEMRDERWGMRCPIIDCPKRNPVLHQISKHIFRAHVYTVDIPMRYFRQLTRQKLVTTIRAMFCCFRNTSVSWTTFPLVSLGDSFAVALHSFRDIQKISNEKYVQYAFEKILSFTLQIPFGHRLILQCLPSAILSIVLFMFISFPAMQSHRLRHNFTLTSPHSLILFARFSIH